MSENIEKFGEKGSQWGLPMNPAVITFIHTGTDPVEFNLLKPILNNLRVTGTIENIAIDFNGIVLGMNEYQYEIGKIEIRAKDFAQRAQVFSYYDHFPRKIPNILMPLSKDDSDVHVVTEKFWIGGSQSLFYRIGPGKEVEMSFYPSARKLIVV